MPTELIERRIYVIRRQKVMIDSDLAELYLVPTKRLNEAVKRNASRFPADFMFQLTGNESEALRSQIATSNTGRGGRRFLPYGFTEHGVAMLSSVLNSERAVQMNILIIRAFVKLRGLLASHQDLARRVEKLEAGQRDNALAIRLVASDVQSLTTTVQREFQKLKSPRRRKARIGFVNAGRQAPILD